MPTAVPTPASIKELLPQHRWCGLRPSSTPAGSVGFNAHRQKVSPIARSINQELTSCKIFLRTFKSPRPHIQQPRGQSLCVAKERDVTMTSDRFVGFVGVDPDEPSVLQP
uniref:Uncharacterized protein n=1 Tax=Oryza sativa subsp. japonica TaxID=39947 RepID=Q2R4G9_ORYSJ|nr:hypothetical protein LOC_Os11g28520 [Oryza sativa Japonica Group]